MFIYVAGPYKAEQTQILDENIQEADRNGRLLAHKGHTPFIPHTMMRYWEGQEFDETTVRRICHHWLKTCQALLYLGSSPGADEEREQAEKLGMKIYESIDDVPQNGEPEAPLKHRVAAYLTEYEQCQESYRHTYQTIWQAGAILIAASGLIITFWDKSGGIAPASVVLAPIPFLVWWWAIFRPMDWYGRTRKTHLVNLETEKLNVLVPGLNLKHFKSLEEARENRDKENKCWCKRWFWKLATPHVHKAVNALGLIMLVAWIVLSPLAIMGKWPFHP